MSTKIKILISALLIIFGATSRLMPHVWNVAPIAAIALFSGAYLGKRYALIVPMLAMLAGDIFLGFYSWKLAICIYLSYAAVGLIGVLIRKNINIKTLLTASLAGSFFFFLLTNWAVWQFSAWYAHTPAGLFDCYAMALPFFRNTIIGDLFFNSVLFGVYALATYWIYYRRTAVEKVRT